MFDLLLLLLLLPFFLGNYEKRLAENKDKKILTQHYYVMAWSLDIHGRENFCCISRCKTCWNMTVDNASMKINLLETSSPVATIYIVFLM